MRVMVHLTIDGEKETKLEGDAPIFGNHSDYKKGFDSRLRDKGFWLYHWRYAGYAGPPHKKGVFVPWGSARFVEVLE